jgi:stress response protein YsnF
VVKEEYQVRKDVLEEEQPVEAEVRKEQVDIDDSTTRPNR